MSERDDNVKEEVCTILLILKTSNSEQRLKSALWYAIGKTVDEETLGLGINATPQFIGALTEMVWAQIANVATDLESFAKSVLDQGP